MDLFSANSDLAWDGSNIYFVIYAKDKIHHKTTGAVCNKINLKIKTLNDQSQGFAYK